MCYIAEVRYMHFLKNMLVLHRQSITLQEISECGVTANILVLGTKDSGFESLHSDKIQKNT